MATLEEMHDNISVEHWNLSIHMAVYLKKHFWLVHFSSFSSVRDSPEYFLHLALLVDDKQEVIVV